MVEANGDSTVTTFGDVFAGIGGFALGFQRAGMVPRWFVENDPYCRKVLAKHWPSVRQYGDVRVITGGELERVDVICGGFPCQDISQAGRRKGIDGARSSLWFEMLRIIRVVRPRIVVVENVAALLIRGMDRVLGDLAESGYDARWSCLPCCAFGAPHSRERLFCIADTDSERLRTWRTRTSDETKSQHWQTTPGRCEWSVMGRWLRDTFQDCYGDASPSDLQRVDEWFPTRVDRCGAVGNAVVPQVTEFIGRMIVDGLQVH